MVYQKKYCSKNNSSFSIFKLGWTWIANQRYRLWEIGVYKSGQSSIKYMYFVILMSNFMNAQNRIVGVYNSVSKTFETNNKTYWINFFENNNARIYKDGYVGLIDTTGTILCEPKYDEIYISEKDVYKSSLNNKYGLLSNKGRELISPSLTAISEFNSGLAIYTQPEEKYGHNRFGIIKSDGTLLTKAEYALLAPREGFGYLFIKNDQVGLIDFNGKETIVYDKKEIDQAITDNVIRIDQAIICKPEKCLPKGNFNSELLKFDDGLTITFKKVGNCYKYGFMNKDFKTVITPKYDWVEGFKNGYSIVSNKDKWGVIDVNGNQIFECKYSILKQINKVRFVVCLNGKYGVIDSKNKIIIPIKYNPIFGLNDNLYVTHNRKKWGVINEKEKLIIPFEYDGVTSGIVTKYESHIFLPTSVPRQTLFGRAYSFDAFGKLEKEGFEFSMHLEGGYNFLFNKENDYSFLFDPSFFSPLSSLSKLENENQLIKANKIIKSGKYDFNEKLKNEFWIVGKEIPYDFHNIVITSVPIRFPKKKYLKGITDGNGEIIVPMLYNEIIDKGVNLVVILLNEKYGVIDFKNNIIFPINYDFIQIGAGVLVLSKRNNLGELESGVFDFFGNELIRYSKSFYQIIDGNILLKEESNSVRFIIDKKGNKINTN
jgi:hypothetical protein